MNDEKIEKLIDAFSDVSFKEVINQKLILIEGILSEFTVSSKEQISRSINSRIKSESSLREKLKRKDYISKWGINSYEKTELQNIICEKLPDLLGFRINCYFKNDEKLVFDSLKNFLEKQDKIEIEIEKNFNLVQKNGHNIYKMACKYKELNNVFSFEVQIKSLLHDTWGEVEHSVIYKSKQFDSRSGLKKDIIDGLYYVLEGADKQLQKLYTSKFSEKEIECDLFCVYTSKNEAISSIHYENFFSLRTFLDGFDNKIKQFLGKKLLGQQISKEQISTTLKPDIDIDRIKKGIDIYKWSEACKIASQIYEFEKNDDFLRYVIVKILQIRDTEHDTEHMFMDNDISETGNNESVITDVFTSLNNFKKEG